MQILQLKIAYFFDLILSIFQNEIENCMFQLHGKQIIVIHEALQSLKNIIMLKNLREDA